ncbi:LTA synthase family protein [Heyndrickxia sp. NPDC080065]|uniref:LTA synthase family protein n=1 Tax=Heyndrickxia sp. NPDC080065 TaxID=3390568 RepID=UPI003CFDE0A8
MKKLNGFSLFILAVVLLWIKTLVIYFFEFDLRTDSFPGTLILLINPIGSIVFFLGLSLFFSSKIRKTALIIFYILLSGLLYGNILYYRFYIDFITVPVLFQFQNVGGLSQSTLELIHWTDPFLFVDIAFLIWALIKRADKGLHITKRKKRSIMGASILLIGVVIIGGQYENPRSLKSYDRELLVKTLGSFNYHIYDILFNSKVFVERAFADSADIKEINQYVDGLNKDKSTSTLNGIANGKNVILISLESTQQLVINRKINGEEITPFLNSLIKESSYFPNFYHQTAQGKTSDAEFIIDNGLYPLSGGSVFVRRPRNEFYALPEILKEQGYYSAVFHSNDETFWNRENMYQTLGYDKFFSKKYYKVTDENSVNYGLKDIPFFEQSIPYLKKLPQPFYAKFLTLTNHFPFLLEPEDQYLNQHEENPGLVERYFQTVRYEDEAIKTFIKLLKKNGLYDNSIIILYGDHYGISKSYYKELEKVLGKEITPSEQVNLQRVPLIIHIPGQKGQIINTIGGQIDIRQTILDILGDTPQKQMIDFGKSLLSDNKRDILIFRDGSFVTDKYTYTENTCFDKSSGEKIKMSKCTPYFNRVQDELNYSDNVIFGDLLRFKYDHLNDQSEN